jgi:hypothetical protein
LAGAEDFGSPGTPFLAIASELTREAKAAIITAVTMHNVVTDRRSFLNKICMVIPVNPGKHKFL